jgi:hypothetical protein
LSGNGGVRCRSICKSSNFSAFSLSLKSIAGTAAAYLGLFARISDIVDRIRGTQLLTAPAAVDTAVGIYDIRLGGVLLINTVFAFSDARAALNAVFIIDYRVPFL